MTAHLATPGPVWLSVHESTPKLPAPLDRKLTVPVGVHVTPASLSVTVAVQVAGWSTATVFGDWPAAVQLTATAVENGGGV